MHLSLQAVAQDRHVVNPVVYYRAKHGVLSRRPGQAFSANWLPCFVATLTNGGPSEISGSLNFRRL
jgi:hypothetical protein